MKKILLCLLVSASVSAFASVDDKNQSDPSLFQKSIVSKKETTRAMPENNSIKVDEQVAQAPTAVNDEITD